jgi:hypothetical protein
MQNTNSRQASGETLDGLGGQGDLGNEDDGLAVAGDELLDATNIDFGLSRAGDAVQEVNGKTGIGQYAVQTAQGLLLLGVRQPIGFGQVGVGGLVSVGEIILSLGWGELGYEALVDEGAEGLSGTLGALAKKLGGQGVRLGIGEAEQGPEDGPLARPEPDGGLGVESGAAEVAEAKQAGGSDRGLLLDGARQHGGQNRPQWAAVIRANPTGQVQQLAGNERLWVDDLADGLEGTTGSTLGKRDAEADLGAIGPSERGLDALADLKRVGQLRWDTVVKELVQGRIEGQRSY